jgi:ubiquitin-protein ligase
MAESGFKFSCDNARTEYKVTLFGPGLCLSNDSIVPRKEHEFEIILGRDYPYAGGLAVHWLTPIFHPNIREEDGKVCIQLLNAWSAEITVVSLVNAILQLLENPNPLDPLNKPAADYFSEHPQAHLQGTPAQKDLPRRPRILSER